MSRRDDLVAVLSATDTFLSAQDVHAAMRAAGSGIGLATVYRVLRSLVADGAADVVHAPDGEARYRLCSRTHHHHLTCRECGRTVEVTAPSVERWARDTARRHGFTAPEHTVELTGRCPACTA